MKGNFILCVESWPCVTQNCNQNLFTTKSMPQYLHGLVCMYAHSTAWLNYGLQ